MKVKELIKKLMRCNPEYEVRYVSEVDYTEGHISYVNNYEVDEEVWIG